MNIDARQLDSLTLFLKLKEILEASHGIDVNIEIRISTAAETKKIKTFISMSGCRADIEKIEDYFIMRIRGTPCCA